MFMFMFLFQQEMQGAEDDDSWMRDGAAELERELAARQKEMEGAAGGKTTSTGFDPQELADRMKVWLHRKSGTVDDSATQILVAALHILHLLKANPYS